MSPFYAEAGSKIDVDVRWLNYAVLSSAADNLKGFFAVVPLIAANPLGFTRLHHWVVLEGRPSGYARHLTEAVSAAGGDVWDTDPLPPPPPPPGGGTPPPAGPNSDFPSGKSLWIRDYALPASSTSHYLAVVGMETDNSSNYPTYNTIYYTGGSINATVVVK